MQKRELEQILQAVSGAFPGGRVEIRDRREPVLPDGTLLRLEEGASLVLTHPLRDGAELRLSLPAGGYPDPTEARHMLEALMTMLGQERARQSAGRATPMYPLLNNLLYADTMERKLYASLLAEEQGKDMSLVRVVCVLSAGEAPLEELAYAISCFRETDSQDICGVMGERHVILCRCLRDAERSVRSQCHSYLTQLSELLEARYGRVPEIWVGTPAKKVEDYRRSWELALAAGKYGQNWPEEGPIHYIGEHLVEYVLDHTDRALSKHFLERDVRLLRQHPALLETAQALLRHDLNLSRAAEARFVHRNTMNLHYRQLRQLLGLDPVRSDRDCFLLMLICAYCTLL